MTCLIFVTFAKRKLNTLFYGFCYYFYLWSLPENADILDLHTLSGSSLLQAIYLEKRSEFIGEAIRPLDIHRRAENYVKRKGTSSEFTITPSTNGYVWPIPTVERANNHLITDD